MTISKDIVDYIADNSSFVIGTDLFIGKLPVGIEEGVIVFEVPGNENDTNMVSQGIRIMSFYNDYLTAQSKCQTAYNLLAHNKGFSINSVRYFNCVPMNSPNFYGTNPHGKNIFAVTIVVFRER